MYLVYCYKKDFLTKWPFSLGEDKVGISERVTEVA